MEKRPGRCFSRADLAKIINGRHGALQKRLADVEEAAVELVSAGKSAAGLQEQYQNTRARIAELADFYDLLGEDF